MEEELSEFVGRLIEAVEDFLWVKNVKIHNPEPRVEGVDDDTIIYGRDYDQLFGDLYEVITTWEVF